jgi:hypothetical protein
VTMQVDLKFGRANFVVSNTNTYSFNKTLQRGKEWCKYLEVESVVSRFNLNIL